MSNTLPHRRQVMASQLDPRIIRGLIQLGPIPDDEACVRNWHRLQDSGRIRPAKAGLDLRRRNCPVLGQNRIDLVSGGRIEARQNVG